MKLKILQQDLLPALQAVSRCVGVRATNPVLANVLLDAQKDKLKLSGTNLEIAVIKNVNAKVLEEGAITVPAKTLLELVSSLVGEEIELESIESLLKVSTKNFHSSLNGIAASEFPAIPLSSEKTISIESGVLKSSIPQISFAAALDEGRPILTGILTEIKKSSLELVATDGFRLAHKTTDLTSKNGVSLRALIPRKTFEEVGRIIAEEVAKDDVLIEIATSENQNQMVFSINQTQLSSRLIEGNFPAWEKIVPQSAVNKTTIDRLELLKAVKLASVFARDAANIIKIETKENKVKLSSEARELGGQETEVEAKTEGEEVMIAFNSKFLTDALSAISTEQVLIEFSGNITPALIKPLKGDVGVEYVVMPIRLS